MESSGEIAATLRLAWGTVSDMEYLAQRLARRRENLSLGEASRDMHLGHVKRAVKDMRALAGDLEGCREEVQLKQARKESPLQYRWGWLIYPTPRTPNCLPRVEASSPGWYECPIDALTAACRDHRLRHNRKDGFYVCFLGTDSPSHQTLGYRLHHCTAPRTQDGSLPSVGSPIHPSHYGESEVSMDAVYKARAEYWTFDQNDGPSGVDFIAMAPPGL